MNARRMTVVPALIAVLACLVACGPSRGDRVASATEAVERGNLLTHLDGYSGNAEDLLVVRNFFEGLGKVAAVCQGISLVVGGDTLSSVLSNVTIARLAWELVDELEFVTAFWEYLESLQEFPLELRMALLDARDNPTPENLAHIATLSASGAERLFKALQILERVEGWLDKAERALDRAEGEIRRFARDADFWGADMVAARLNKLVKLVQDKLVNRASRELRALTQQLRQDIEVLIYVAEETNVPPNKGCSCGIGLR